MNIHLNEKMIARRAKIGRYVSTAGLLVLLIGMVFTFRGPQYTWVTFGALMIGLVASQVGTYHMRRWGRTPRPDEMLTAALKGLDKRYHFYGWLLPAEHVLLGPSGLFVLVAKDQTGQVSYQGGRWRQPFRWSNLLTIFARESIGDPVGDATRQAERLRRFIADRLGAEAAAQLPIEPVVTFLADGVQLTLVQEPSVPVLPVKKLKEYIRGQGKGEKISAGQRQALVEAFAK
jgi:hypothetical protein